jgi:hypothetical protein
MNTPQNLKSAANFLIAIGFFYVLVIAVMLGILPHAPDTFGKVFAGCMLGLGLLLWLAAFLLYRRNNAGKYIGWVCCPFVLAKFPIGTILGFLAFAYLNKPDSKAALAGKPLDESPFLPD